MGAQTKITITHDVAEVAGDLQSKGITGFISRMGHINWLQNLIAKMSGGASNGTIATTIDAGDGVAATGTVTFSSLANNDTVTVGTQTFTAKTSGASGANQFNLGANDTDAGANFATAVNAHTSLTGVVTASAAAGVTTLTTAIVGLIGNQIGIAISAHGSVSGAKLTTGAAPTSSVSTSHRIGV